MIPPTMQIDPEAPIRAFACHKYKQVFAVGLRNDTVYLYDLNNEGMQTESHPIF